MLSILFCFTLLKFATAIYEDYYHWHAPAGMSPTADGLSQTFNVHSGNLTGLYMANDFNFDTGPQGYFGIQPQNSNGFMAVFSYFGDNASSYHPNCKPGADNGNGMSCHVYFDLVYDRNYTLSMSRVSENSNNTITWGCHLTDDFGTNIDIGWWTVPKSTLLTWTTQFLEWYEADQKTNCLPKLDYKFWTPIFSLDGVSHDLELLSQYHEILQDHCTVNSGVVNATNEIYEQIPGKGYRTIVGQYTPDSNGYYYAKPLVSSSAKATASTTSLFSSFKTLLTSTTGKTQTPTTTTHSTTATTTTTPASATTTSALDELLNSLGLGDLSGIFGDSGNPFNW